ncbi:MAG: hypothetical protein JNL28_01685 [Planctomycetes bacterium]|nr:hypothetical protein [Planctomycetota bacterium]
MKTYTIRAMTHADDDGAFAAWNSVTATSLFARTRSRDEWTWAYRDNPAGRAAFVAEHEGGIAALYAALPIKTWIEGEVHTFGRIVDSLVLPAHRSGLKRPGLFVGVGRKFFEHFGLKDSGAVFFGWPEEQQWRVGERFLSYAPLRHEIVLAREVPEGTGAVPESVEEISRFGPELRDLYERSARAFGASTVRDDIYMNWRTVDRPNVRYRRFGVRDAQGMLRGVAVQRTCHFLGEEASTLVDWLVPHEEEAVADRLLAALAACTRADRVRRLYTLVPPWSSWFEWFQSRGFQAQPTEYVLGGRSFSARHDLGWLRERWWYQLSDSDFV